MRPLEFFIRFGLVLFVIAGISLAFVKIPSPEFYLLLVTIFLSGGVALIGFIIRRYSREE